MANGALPDFIPLEDAIDLCDFLEATGRTVPRTKWATECIEAANRAKIEAMLG